VGFECKLHIALRPFDKGNYNPLETLTEPFAEHTTALISITQLNEILGLQTVEYENQIHSLRVSY